MDDTLNVTTADGLDKLTDLAKMRQKAADELKGLEEEAKQAKLKRDALDQALMDLMADQGLKSFGLATGGKVIACQRTFYSCPASERPVLRAWAETNGHADSLTINAQTLSAIMKERKEAGDALPDFISAFDKEYLSFRK